MNLMRGGCILLAAFFAASIVTLLLYTERRSWHSEMVNKIFKTYAKKFEIPRTRLNFSHLQPLREMFAKLTIKTPKKSDCMVEPAEFSDLTELENKIPVFLLIVVSTAPSRQDRREAIRKTWWTKCGGEVVCKFFTDGLQISKEDQEKLLREKKDYKDLEFQPVVGGRTFGLRYLYHMIWAAAKYNFQYYLRLDDDFFVCLGRLRNELRYRPTKTLLWGHYHCHPGLTFIDEAWTLFTPDVVVRILSQDPQKIQCHPHADQELPFWMDSAFNKTEKVIRFHDWRLYFYPPAKTVDKFKNRVKACDQYLGIHGSSPELMYKFWNTSNDGPKNVSPVTEFSSACRYPFFFNISLMWDRYKYDLRPCIENPLWTTGETMWIGVLTGTKKGTFPCP